MPKVSLALRLPRTAVETSTVTDSVSSSNITPNDERLAKVYGITPELYVELKSISARRAQQTRGGNPEIEVVS